MKQESKMAEDKTSTGDEAFESGFTWRSLLAVLYSIFIFTPAIIWISLQTVGVSIAAAVEVCTLLLFVEYSRLTGHSLKIQEATIIFGISSIAGSAGFLGFIYRAYYVRSPLLLLFNINRNAIPTWWAPPYGSGVWEARTLLAPEWFMPIIIFLIMNTLHILVGLSLGLLGREFYIEGEKLPFPFQQMNVAAISTLVERDGERYNAFIIAAILSMLYGIVLYTIPTASRAFGVELQFLPIPWIDFWFYIQRVLPGATLGFATDLIHIAYPILLPNNIVWCLFIGSFFRFFIMNPLLVRLGLTDWGKRWVPGMDCQRILQESTLYFWMNPIIGISIAVGVIPIVLNAKIIFNSLRSLFKRVDDSNRISGSPVDYRVLIGMWLLGSVGLTVLTLLLVPDFPITVLLLYCFVFPLVGCLILTRMVGIAGGSTGFPYLRELLLASSGYAGLDAWFVPLPLVEHLAGTGFTCQFKICQLTKTTVTSWIKMFALGYVLSLVMGFVYVEAFWRVAPIPSYEYPAPAIVWPLDVMFQSLWISKPTTFWHPDYMLYSFVITAVLTALAQRVPQISMVSIAIGLNIPLPMMMTNLIALLIKYVLGRLKGRNWVEQTKGTIAAGVFAGEGVAIVIGIAIAIVRNSLWTAPY